MKNRLFRMGKALIGTACLLTTCGVAYSCSDDYDLPDTKPEFLGSSIYDELKNRGNFTTVVRLIDDLGYTDVLSRTGSRTLFVADDEAYDKFFSTTTWTDGNGNPVRNYNQLSLAQKKILVNNCMLNNAYLLEMMPNLSGSSTVTKDVGLRQGTTAAVTDSIAWFAASELPVTYSNTERDYWKDLRDRKEASGEKVLIAMDNTSTLMTHFMLGQMNMQGITTDDISFVLNLPDSLAWRTGQRRNFIYDAEVRTGRDANGAYQSDVTCLNGYFNVLDKVMLVPSNMAEAIRQNSNTKLYSHILDRFSAPFPDGTLQDEYESVYGQGSSGDTLYVKRYFSNRSQGENALNTAPDGTSVTSDVGLLSYDPGWNLYNNGSDAAERDMAAMFVPNDSAVRDYFLNLGGRMFIERYNPDYVPGTPVNDDEELLRLIDQIPKNRLQPLINNLMKSSFNASVPSKYLSIMNDARDPMFVGMSQEDYKAGIEKCILANNGVVYVMKGVTAPAAYSAVSGPALVSDQAEIINSIITADDNYIQGSAYNSAPMKQYFSTYLRAMQSHFTLFIPTDEALGSTGYVDPAVYNAPTARRYWQLTYNPPSVTTTTSILPVDMYAFNFDPTTGQQPGIDASKGNAVRSLSTQALTSGYGITKRYIAMELMNQHIIVHDSTESKDYVSGDAQYYLARNGAPVFIESKGEADGTGMVVKGGFQLMMDKAGVEQQCNVVETYNMTAENNNNYGNGMTYFIDRAMQPTMTNVRATLTGNAEFSKFYNLLAGYDLSADPNNPDPTLSFDIGTIVDDAGFTEGMPAADAIDERNKYQVFSSAQSYAYVRFFNNYRYTVYVPTNEAIDYAVNTLGLPTWSRIRSYLDTYCNAEDPNISEETLAANKKIAQAMVTCLVNFLRYHFQDGSIFLEKHVTESTDETETSCVDSESNVYLKAYHIDQAPNSLSLTDEGGVRHSVNPSLCNFLTRDMETFVDRSNGVTTNPTQAYAVTSSSYSVLHALSHNPSANQPGCLLFKQLENGKIFNVNTGEQATAFVKKYRIRK